MPCREKCRGSWVGLSIPRCSRKLQGNGSKTELLSRYFLVLYLFFIFLDLFLWRFPNETRVEREEPRVSVRGLGISFSFFPQFNCPSTWGLHSSVCASRTSLAVSPLSLFSMLFLSSEPGYSCRHAPSTSISKQIHSRFVLSLFFL